MFKEEMKNNYFDDVGCISNLVLLNRWRTFIHYVFGVKQAKNKVSSCLDA